MSTTALIASAAYTPDFVDGPVCVVLDGAHIARVSREEVRADSVVDLRPLRLAPGYIDLHTHGFGGYDVNTSTEADLLGMAAALPATGVTAFLPTIGSAAPAATRRQVERAAAALRQSNEHAAAVAGIRLEGPFINRAKKGAQDESAIRPPDPDELAQLLWLAPIRLVDFAPELDADFRLLRTLVGAGVVACVGHTAASYDDVLAAIDAGARHCTHLFNAMPPLEHRAPGAAGALLTDGRATVEIIADGVHVHPAVLRLAVAARGARGVALVTDAMSAAGLPAGEYAFLGRNVVVRDGAVRQADGTLAGSILTMDRGVRNLVALAGIDWPDAIRMATATPASIAGLAEHKGSLAPGMDADLVALDGAGYVRRTWRAGRTVFSS